VEVIAPVSNPIQKSADQSFCLFKLETYLLRKQPYIMRRIEESGLEVVDTFRVRIAYRDLLTIYQEPVPRITMSLRWWPFKKLDLYVLEGPDAIDRMRRLKYRIRRELLGVALGGFVHAPNDLTELHKDMGVLRACNVG